MRHTWGKAQHLRARSLAMAAASSVLVVTGALGAVPAAAQEAGTGVCDKVILSVQANVVLAAKAREVAATVLPIDCWDWEAFDFRWEGYATNGVSQDRVVWAPFDMVPVPTIVDPIQVTDTKQLGVWTWRPTSAYGPASAPVSLSQLNTTTMDVRLGSVSYVAATRSYGKVTVKTRAYRWWQSTHAWGAWGLSRGVIQYRTPGTSTWISLKNVYSDNYGRYSYTYTTSARREYRVVMAPSTYVWGNTSANTATR